MTLFSSTISLAQPTAPGGKKWVKIDNLSDEFNQGFDDSKWEKVLWDYPGTPTKMIEQNSGVSDGSLWIKATLDDSSPTWFQSSRVYSKAQIKYPMYTECSMITAHLSAYNTFWLNNGNIDNRDEIDVVENNSRPSCCEPNFPWQMNSQYFQVVNGDTKRNKGNFDNRNLSPGNPKRGVKWNEEYHTVGVWWKDAKNIQFYLDGEPAGSVVSARDFTRDLNLIWDLWTDDQPWLGGLAVKSHLTDESINTMRVDWVHTYQLVGDGTGGGGPGPDPAGAYRLVPVKSGDIVSPINGSDANDAGIVNSKNVSGNAALWKFVDKGDGYVEVVNARSNRCLAVPGGNPANGTKLIQWNCLGIEDQQWKRIDTGEGKFAFQNRETGKCMDLTRGNTANNVPMQQWDCNDSNVNQQFWILAPEAGSRLKSAALENVQIAVYPNPVMDKIELDGLKGDVEKVLILNLQGKVVLEQQVPVAESKISIDLNNLNEGIYFIKAGKHTQKFIKK